MSGRYRELARTMLAGALVFLAACASEGVQPDEVSPAARINLNLGIAYLQKGDYQRSLDKFQRALEEAPDFALAHAGIAVLYERIRDLDQAETHFRRALELDPDAAQIHNNFGAYLCRRGRVDEALAEFEAAAGNHLYKTPEKPYTNAGLCVLKIPDTARAEAYFRSALEANPRYAPALWEMARLSFASGEALRARAYLQRLHEVSAPTPDSLWLSIRVERALGDLDTAASQALLLRSRFPGSEQARLAADMDEAARGREGARP